MQSIFLFLVLMVTFVCGSLSQETFPARLDSIGEDQFSAVADCTGTIIPAVVEGDIEQLEILLASSPELVNTTCENCDETPLGVAIKLRQSSLVDFLLLKGVNVNLSGDCSDPPLFIAAELGYPEIVETLVAAGALLQVHDEFGHTPLQQAALAGHIEVVKVLSSKGLSYDIYSAAACGDIQRMEDLIADNPEIVDSTKDRGDATPLFWAVRGDQLASVEFLLRKGAKVEAREIEGRLPLHYAKSNQVTQFLLDHGAKPNTRSTNKIAPLHDAAVNGEDDVVECLLAAGAKVNATDVLRSTPLHFAVMYDHFTTARILIENGADVNAKQYEGQTPLHYAAAEGSQEELISFLAKEGANLDEIDRQGRRPIDLAMERGHQETVEILRRLAPNARE